MILYCFKVMEFVNGELQLYCFLFCFTDPQTAPSEVDGVNLEEIREFAKAFKIRRLSLGLTQTQVGQALSATEGPAYSQSAICRYGGLTAITIIYEYRLD